MSVLDTLEICFQANLGGAEAQLNALAQRLGALDGAAQTADRALAEAGSGMARSLGSGFLGAMPELKRRIGAAGQDWSARLGQGILSGRASVGAAAKQLAGAVRFDGSAAAAKSAGRALSEGFAAGIRERSGSVRAAVSAMVSSATQRIRSLLSIHSPSKVTQALGANFGEGFSLGVTESISGAERAAAALSNAAGAGLRAAALPDLGGGASIEDSVQRAVDRALGEVQVTIPLQVDGMKLGEASIRGINAVTRSTGRVLLKL